MKSTIKYWKNSNTGELIITDMPINYYNAHGMSMEDVNLKGFIEVKKKTFLRLRKQQS